MRIIAGKYRGLKLDSPKNSEIRPTTDRLKEDIFNILSPYIPDCSFLDLFSGSGSIGLEALSRGAANVTMVEADRQSLALIKRNAEKLKNDAPNIILKRVKNFLIETNGKYDIIFMDPPYAFSGADELFSIIENRALLNPGGVIVYEQSSASAIKQNYGVFELSKTKKISMAAVSFYKQGKAENGKQN